MPNKQSEKSEATKQRLLEAAQSLFYQKGFEKTAVREIVKAAGVAQGTFYLYFETKEQVLFQILEKAFQNFNRYFAQLNLDNPSLQDIDFLIDTIVLYMETNPDTMKLLHMANILEIMRITKYDIVSEWSLITLIEKWLTKADSDGVIRCSSPKLYARMLFLIAHELIESAFLYEFPEKVGVMKEEVKKVIKNILR